MEETARVCQVQQHRHLCQVDTRATDLKLTPYTPHRLLAQINNICHLRKNPPGMSWKWRQTSPRCSPSLPGYLIYSLKNRLWTKNWNCSSFTNDFSHRDPGGFGEIHLMFPLTAMLNHSCFPNIARWRKCLILKERWISAKPLVPNFLLRSVRRHPQGGFLMRVVAARPIKKGEMRIQHINCQFCFI